MIKEQLNTIDLEWCEEEGRRPSCYNKVRGKHKGTLPVIEYKGPTRCYYITYHEECEKENNNAQH